MDGFDFNSSEKADASELQRMIAIEQQKAQFQAQVHNFTEVCWDKCMDGGPSSKLDSRTEICLVNCVDQLCIVFVCPCEIHNNSTTKC
uniref:Mitochondrial import inner membrane translocase subunit n=1 Tax=Esox lucius TaxID=8010 RepID=A0A6Q2YVL1_ESOLU